MDSRIRAFGKMAVGVQTGELVELGDSWSVKNNLVSLEAKQIIGQRVLVTATIEPAKSPNRDEAKSAASAKRPVGSCR